MPLLDLLQADGSAAHVEPKSQLNACAHVMLLRKDACRMVVSILLADSEKE